MAPDQPTTETPNEKLNRLIERIAGSLEKLATGYLGVRQEIANLIRTHVDHYKELQATGQAHLTQLVLLNSKLEALGKLEQLPMLMQAISEARKDIERVQEHTDKSLDGLRDDLTPVHGTPLPTRAELDAADDAAAKVKIGPVTFREKLLGKLTIGLPWLMIGMVIGLIAVLYVLSHQGDTIGIVPKPPASSAPALPVPQLAPPPHVVP